MVTNKVADANKRFADSFSKALDTLTAVHWDVYSDPDKAQDKLFDLQSIELKNSSGIKQHCFSARMETHVVQDKHLNRKKVRTKKYIYTTYDKDGNESYGFHWHPDLAPFPHLHVEASDPKFASLSKQHIPTGRVAFEDVLRFLFTELGIKPRRNDWQKILAQTRQHFDEDKSWS